MSVEALDPAALPSGTQVGHYKVVAPLGAGGMGTVYRATRDGTEVAIKFARGRLSELSSAEREQTESRVRREVSILFAVNHPNLVRIHAADRWPDLGGHLYIVTDLVEGQSLYDWQRRKSPSLRALCELLLELADAVSTLHKALFIHRDLKSSNVVVQDDGTPVIIDFGIARQRHSYTLTGIATLIGTADHQSPEFCRFLLDGSAAKGDRYVYKPTDDLHALGVMAYQALTGRPAFLCDDDNEYALMQDIARTLPPEPSSLAPIPHALSAVVMKLLAKDPLERWQSGSELADALETVLEGADNTWDAPYGPPAHVPARPSGKPTAEGRRRSRSRPSQPEPVASDSALARIDAVVLPSASGGPISEELLAQVLALPKAAEGSVPYITLSGERQAGFVPLESERPMAKVMPLHPGLPSGLRDHAARLTANERGPTTRKWAAITGALALAVLALAWLWPTQASTSLLSEYRSTQDEVAASPVTIPASGSLAAVGPQELEATPPAVDARTDLAAEGPPVREPPRHSVRTPAPPGARERDAEPAAPVVTQPRLLGAPAEAVAARTLPAGLRCKVQLKGELQAGLDASSPVEVVFRAPCFRNGEQELIPEWSTASGVARASGGRVLMAFDAVRLIGVSEPVKASAVAVQGGQQGIPGARSLRQEAPMGGAVVATAGRLAEVALLSQLPPEARDLARSAQPTPAVAPEAGAPEWVSLRSGTEFFLVFKELQP